jgi:hypothetical protein
LDQLDDLSLALWKSYAAGALSEGETQRLSDLIDARRAAARVALKPIAKVFQGRRSIFPARRRLQFSPDRARSIERRRRLAASGPMPPVLAAKYTTSQLAVLAIVAGEVAERGQCTLPIPAIAARAGVCHRTTQYALRFAEGDGLLTIEERAHQYQINDPNIVRIASAEWLLWLEHGGRRKRGCKNLRATVTGFQPLTETTPVDRKDAQRNRAGAQSGTGFVFSRTRQRRSSA